MWKKTKPYIIGILLPLFLGLISSFLTRDNMSIYETINKPLFAPKPIVFPIVWSILYVLMGISSVRIYLKKDEFNVRPALLLYATQLVINFFFPIIFFNLRVYLFSFIWVILLLIFVIFMFVSFYKIDYTAAFLNILYVLWLIIALYLTFTIYLLN